MAKGLEGKKSVGLVEVERQRPNYFGSYGGSHHIFEKDLIAKGMKNASCTGSEAHETLNEGCSSGEVDILFSKDRTYYVDRRR